MGLVVLERGDGDGECSLRVLVRIPARDFRKPWAEDGRLGVSIACPFGGADGDHGFPVRSASSYMVVRAAIAEPKVFCGPWICTEQLPSSGIYRGVTCLAYTRLDPQGFRTPRSSRTARFPPAVWPCQRTIRRTSRMRLTVIRLIWSSCHVSIDTDRTKLVVTDVVNSRSG